MYVHVVYVEYLLSTSVELFGFLPRSILYHRVGVQMFRSMSLCDSNDLISLEGSNLSLSINGVATGAMSPKRKIELDCGCHLPLLVSYQR